MSQLFIVAGGVVLGGVALAVLWFVFQLAATWWLEWRDDRYAAAYRRAGELRRRPEEAPGEHP